MNENQVRANIAKNITSYRKALKLTQAQLAEKISYSDKAISKWERGEAIPDTYVLLELCELFNITLNDIVSEKIVKTAPVFKRNRITITFLSTLIAWLVATIVFVSFNFYRPFAGFSWVVFIFAIPVSFIILLVFACIWGNKILRLITITGLIWSCATSLFFIFYIFVPILKDVAWFVFLVGIPVQIGFLAFSLIKRKPTEREVI